jgi:hypothetical protein
MDVHRGDVLKVLFGSLLSFPTQRDCVGRNVYIRRSSQDPARSCWRLVLHLGS